MHARNAAVVACGAILLGFLGVSPAGCASDMVVGTEMTSSGPPPLAAPPDAAIEASQRTLTDYCPSNKCSAGYTTCPESKFLCDVDLRSDPNNCGACGAACPATTSSEEFDCLDGRCVMRCRVGNADCDGLIDNGCESNGESNDNCGACGVKCDASAPCNRAMGGEPRCGCPEPFTYCEGATPLCQRLDFTDAHCGACGNKCDPTGGPGAPPLPPNATYGCGEGTCGHLKCKEGFGDCNSDLGTPNSDGCETKLGTHDHCTQCGDDCRVQGMNCVWDLPFKGIACRCPPGENFCGTTITQPFLGTCANFTSDPRNCGACGRECPGLTKRSKGVCEYGECKLECSGRWADCNGNLTDDCEVDTFSDPRNCGGCGITCDIAAGQACAGGRCVVEPCDGEVAR